MINVDQYLLSQKYKNNNKIDGYFLMKIKEIIEKYNINTIVETGVDRGDSCVVFAQLVENVISIEISDESINYTRNRLLDYGLDNVTLIKGNSPIVLLELMRNLEVNKTLFFLDAHWGAYWPLLDEIDTISRNKGVIVIHDVQVPNKPEFGYDTWGGNILNYDYVKEALSKWSKNHKYEYSQFYDHENPRGTLYVYPN